MKTWIIIILFILPIGSASSQNYQPFQEKIRALHLAALNKDSIGLKSAWSMIIESGIPLMGEDSVAFFYKGEAKSVSWMGDFNQWGYDKQFKNEGKRIAESDLWILKTSFPQDARLDYKIFVNGRNWIIDPLNPYQQWSGVGVNSELRMPLWKDDPVHKKRPDSPKGEISNDILFTSKILGYPITYNIYRPYHTPQHVRLDALYVLDGYEYMHTELGDMLTVLNNLIEDKKIAPITVVFIDHRDPINRTINRRMEELAMNNTYLEFFKEEFLPHIESKHAVLLGAEHRAIMGNSVGALSATYFAFSRPQLFSMVGIQSPAFYLKPQIYSLCDDPESVKTKVSMTSGMINDSNEGGRKMKTILENNACQYIYREVNEGHSWGNWRNLIDDILVDFFGTK